MIVVTTTLMMVIMMLMIKMMMMMVIILITIMVLVEVAFLILHPTVCRVRLLKHKLSYWTNKTKHKYYAHVAHGQLSYKV